MRHLHLFMHFLCRWKDRTQTDNWMEKYSNNGRNWNRKTNLMVISCLILDSMNGYCLTGEEKDTVLFNHYHNISLTDLCEQLKCQFFKLSRDYPNSVVYKQWKISDLMIFTNFTDSSWVNAKRHLNVVGCYGTSSTAWQSTVVSINECLVRWKVKIKILFLLIVLFIFRKTYVFSKWTILDLIFIFSDCLLTAKNLCHIFESDN